jgi:hypothetical protein
VYPGGVGGKYPPPFTDRNMKTADSALVKVFDGQNMSDGDVWHPAVNPALYNAWIYGKRL